jgi:hypothetical protein
VRGEGPAGDGERLKSGFTTTVPLLPSSSPPLLYNKAWMLGWLALWIFDRVKMKHLCPHISTNTRENKSDAVSHRLFYYSLGASSTMHILWECVPCQHLPVIPPSPWHSDPSCSLTCPPQLFKQTTTKMNERKNKHFNLIYKWPHLFAHINFLIVSEANPLSPFSQSANWVAKTKINYSVKMWMKRVEVRKLNKLHRSVFPQWYKSGINKTA